MPEQSNPELSRAVGLPLAVGIGLLPWLFSWYTLRAGYSTRARAVSFVWLFIVLVKCSSFGSNDSRESREASSAPSAPENTPSTAAAASPESEQPPHKSFYAIERVTKVRLGPSSTAPVTNELYRQDKVDVYETKNGWARVTEFYDGRVEDVQGQVARWVPLKSLSDKRPGDLPQPGIVADARIVGIPKVGENGLKERDVLILQAAARYFLQTGEAERVALGDKSVSKPGVYYLNFGGPSNRFFKPSDIPNIEQRIRELQKKK